MTKEESVNLNIERVNFYYRQYLEGDIKSTLGRAYKDGYDRVLTVAQKVLSNRDYLTLKLALKNLPNNIE